MLTDSQLQAAIANAKREKRAVVLFDRGGARCLSFRAGYSGKGTFCYEYRPEPGANVKRVTLGGYAKSFGLAQARAAAAVLTGKRAAGIDPAAEVEATTEAQRVETKAREARETAEALRISFDALAQNYLASVKRRPFERAYRLDIAPVLGKLVAADVQKRHIQLVVDRLVKRGSPIQARRVYEITRAILRFGVERDHVQGTPWLSVVLPDKSGARDRVLSAAELRWLWNAVENTKLPAWTEHPRRATIIRLQILLGQRIGEVCGMRRDEISRDLLTWTIPAERSKNGQPHCVPLAPLARELVAKALGAIPADQQNLFQGARGKVERVDVMVHRVAELIAEYNDSKPHAEHLTSFGTHDLRRTVATAMQTMGIRLDVISATLNHISAKAGSVTTRHYTHADLSLEVRAALTRWQGGLAGILAGADPFEAQPEDIAELEAKALAKGFGGPARLRVVS